MSMKTWLIKGFLINLLIWSKGVYFNIILGFIILSFFDISWAVLSFIINIGPESLIITIPFDALLLP